jgi:phage N-6-adenine-methyltransferase
MANESSGLFKRAAACFSSKVTEYGTPRALFEGLNKEFHFVLDAATTPDNPLGTRFFYTSENNALTKSWDLGGNVFCNPPYSRGLLEWVEKGYRTVLESPSNITVVMLIPARTDTKFFHTCVWKDGKPRPGVEVRFIQGRLRFESSNNIKQNSAPFPSMLVIFRPQLSEQHQQQRQLQRSHSKDFK